MTASPGPELDAAVHRALFGKTHLYCRYGEIWDGEPLKSDFDRLFYIPSGKPWRTHHIDAIPLPRYSSSIAAAWEVVERMKSLGFTVSMTDWAVPVDPDDSACTGAVVVFVHREDPRRRGRTNGLDGLTAAGICAAALKALGEEARADG